MIELMRVNIKLLNTYTCFKCRKKLRGSTHKNLSFNCTSIEDVENYINKQTLEPSYMPVGWASFYNPIGTIFKCDECIH